MPAPKRTNRWVYGIAAFALSLVVYLGADIVGTEGELQEVKQPLAAQCVNNGYVFDALRQTCEDIVDEDTPDVDAAIVPPDSPVERFPNAPATPVPRTVIRPGEPILGLPNGFTPVAPGQTVVLTPGPASPPVTVAGVAPPQSTVTLAAPPPQTVTQPAPPAQTETVTLAAPPPETVTETAPPQTVTEIAPPETVTETAPPVTETTTVTETTGPPPIIGVN